jgi:GTPase KRas
MIRTKRGTAKFILVGNKFDKQHQREVSTEDGYKLAVDWGCKFFETSAKTRHNVEEAFTSIIRTLRASGRENTEAAPRPQAPQRQKWYQKCVVL